MADQDERQELEAQEQGAVEEQPVAPEGAGETEAVAEPKAQPTAEPQDLSQIPKFREYQSARDRKEAEYQQQLERLRKRASDLERQQYELATAGMKKSDRAEYDLQIARRQIAEMQQQMQQQGMRENFQRLMVQNLQRLDLKPEEAPDPSRHPSFEAWLSAAAVKAMEKARSEAERKIEREKKKIEARKEATQIDTGSAAPSGGELSDLKAQMRKLRNTGQVARAWEIQREIDRLAG